MNLNNSSRKISDLLPVTIQNLSDIKPTLEFYMGKNTPARKEFIMQNLVNDRWMILKHQMKDHFIQYASYVILDRAIPNVDRWPQTCAKTHS